MPHASKEMNEQGDDDDEINESVDNTFTRNEPLWRDRRRGMSFTNSKECNEIVRQFLQIDFDEGMILTERFSERQVANDTSVNKEPTDVD